MGMKATGNTILCTIDVIYSLYIERYVFISFQSKQ